MNTTIKAVMLGAVVLVIAAWGLAGPLKTKVTTTESNPKTYSIITFLQPNWEIAMHETFTHYLQAAKTFGEGNYQNSIAFLICMEYYVNYLPKLIPDKTPPPASKPINKELFKKDIEQLRLNTIRLRQLIEKKDYKKATEIAPDAITKLCFDCHQEAKVPPKFQLGGYKVQDVPAPTPAPAPK